MTNRKQDLFSSRWAFLIAALGMAIGAGNIWRFPRLAGQYGGSFLIPWVIFLFIWSIPLIIIEFSVGKKWRLSVPGAFKKALGTNYAWMGWFVAICTSGIMFYYGVVSGWSLKYFLMSLTGHIQEIDHKEFWQQYTTGNLEAVWFLIIAFVLAGAVIVGGIARGIERATKILVPLLFMLMIIADIRAITLPNSMEGIKYFFRINSDDLMNYKVWLEALSQSAWSTGAGWGLIMTYATYVKKEESVLTNSILTGIGNNLASIIAGLAIIPAVFALSASNQAALESLSAGNQGLTFIMIPQLFASMPGSIVFTSLFFLALFIAALSSLLSMIELAVKVLMDYKYSRKGAVIRVVAVSVLAGFPSAYFIGFFNNQDWVWGIGLLLSGFFFILFVNRVGISRFLMDYLEWTPDRAEKYKKYIKTFSYVMIVEFLAMLIWWLVQSISWYPDSWWHPFKEFSIGTCLFQWMMVILTGLLLSFKLKDRVQ